MYKVFYNDEALLNVDNFVEYLKKYYKNIYFDTWLVNEEQILSWYINSTEILFDEVIFAIDSTIEKWYLWNIFETKVGYEKSKLVISIRSYTIKILIKKVKKEVFIEDIFF